ncbi:hypothetical protein WJX72_007163 [[Myrmecia] bisecta]|uniref:Uncharacterized protein n=1 Tax=[Myrmecia] bisecta TaxID=41462 RepID=A0AAW1QC16_9CHLO
MTSQVRRFGKTRAELPAQGQLLSFVPLLGVPFCEWPFCDHLPESGRQQAGRCILVDMGACISHPKAVAAGNEYFFRVSKASLGVEIDGGADPALHNFGMDIDATHWMMADPDDSSTAGISEDPYKLASELRMPSRMRIRTKVAPMAHALHRQSVMPLQPRPLNRQSVFVK